MPRSLATLLASSVLLTLPLTAYADALRCPKGTQKAGRPPPEGLEAWCEAKDLFGGISKSGPYRRWHRSGELAMEGSFLDGKKHGLWRSYAAGGALVLEEEYNFGKLQRSSGRGTGTEAPPSPRAQPTQPTQPVQPTQPTQTPAGDPAPPEETHWAEPPGGGWIAEETLGPRPFVHSAWGPKAKTLQLGVGLRMIAYLPSLDFNLVYAIHENAHFEARVASLGVLTLADMGFRFRLSGDQSFSLALRTDLNVFAILNFFGGNGLTMGPMPGLVLSMGSKTFQFSIVMDVPMWTFATVGAYGVGSASGTLFAMWLRPSLTFEVGLGEDVSLYIQLMALLGPISEFGSALGGLPFLTIGASF